MGFDLLPRELDKLQTVSLAGQLAQRRLARGLRLNPVEATALIAHVLHELIRDGNHSVAQLMAIGEPCARAGEGKGGTPEGLLPDNARPLGLAQPDSPTSREEARGRYPELRVPAPLSTERRARDKHQESPPPDPAMITSTPLTPRRQRN